MHLLTLPWLETPSRPALSRREREVLQHLAAAEWPREIAAALHLSVRTIETHCARIRQKWRLRNQAQLYQEAVTYTQAGTQAALPDVTTLDPATIMSAVLRRLIAELQHDAQKETHG